MDFLQSQPRVPMIETWQNTTRDTFSDWLVARNGVIERSDSESAPPSPKSVAGPSNFQTSGTVGSDFQTPRQTSEPSDGGYSTSIYSSASTTRPNASRHSSGLSTPSMAGISVSTISSSSLATTEFSQAEPFERDDDGNPIMSTPPQITEYPCA